MFGPVVSFIVGLWMIVYVIDVLTGPTPSGLGGDPEPSFNRPDENEQP